MKDKEEPAGEGHETRDADTLSLVLLAVLVVIMTFLVVLICSGLFHYYSAQARPPAEVNRPFPEPRLQVAPEQDLKALRARDEAELHSYAWIDRRAGTVRIPIERAMDMLLARGLPVRGQPGASPPHVTDLQLQQARPLQ
jgi:hypothetical protein